MRGPPQVRSVLRWPGAALAALWVSLVVGPGCPSEPRCVVEDLDPDCAPLYTPSWAEVHARTLAPTCGLSGPGCHAPEGAEGGFVVTGDPAADRQALLDDGRVAPGDAACSQLMVRLEASDDSLSMPPGDRLPAAERCAVQRWIDAGADP